MERRSRCRWVPGKRRKDRFGIAESAERKIFEILKTQKGAERALLVGWVTYVMPIWWADGLIRCRCYQ